MATTRIGRFELLRELGSGAMGVVYRARDTRLQRDVALKLIRPERVGDRGLRQRFLRESRAAAALNHFGIATLYEADETDDGRLYLVSELVEGETLTSRLRRGPLSGDDCLTFGRQLAEALAEAHQQGIVHRDIKPDNLMITHGGQLKILDFGLARLGHTRTEESDRATVADTVSATAVGAVVGTPRYMSPEQAAGATVDTQSDVFAAGAVLYEMATGRPAFAGQSVEDTLRKILSEEPRPLDTINRKLPADLVDVIRRAMSKSPDDRFNSGREMAASLRQIGTAPTATRGRRAWAWAAAAVVLISVAAALVWWFSRSTLAFGDRDKLLIADVDNRTGDEVFDLALQAALESDLQQSPYVLVYGKKQVGETLQLLRREPTAFINEELGRDICRFAGIRALVVPRILAMGDIYDLQAVLVDPVSGRHVETLRATARGREEVLLEAVDALAREVRSRLGESLASIEETDLPVVQHTTSSWEALHSLVLADRAWQENKFQESGALFERALEYDPDFMAAKGSLGLLLIQFLGDPETGKEWLRAAVADADEVTERERLMIKALKREFVDGDLEGALREYDVVISVYPDIFAPYNNKGQILFRLGRYEEALAEFEKASAVEPRSTIPLWALVRVHVWALRDPAAGEAAARRLVELIPHNPDAVHIVAWSLIGQRRFEEAERILQDVLSISPEHVYALPNRAHVLMVLERPAEAVPLYRKLKGLVAEGRLPGRDPETGLLLGLALKAAGETAEAERVIEKTVQELFAGRDELATPGELIDLAALEAARGRADEARSAIGGALDLGVNGPWELLQLGDAYALLGDRDAAVDALERALRAGFDDVYYLWIKPSLDALQDDPRLDALVERRPS